MPIRLTVNGEPREYAGDPEMPLLWYLRDEAKLKGTKFGCGVGECRACTVHIDGDAQQSCITKMADIEGRAITTIEGLSADGTHPVQRAWVEQDVAQCGYCQAGQIMTAAALLARVPAPGDADIDGAMGNLCRCGTYNRIRAAIKRAAELKRQEA